LLLIHKPTLQFMAIYKVQCVSAAGWCAFFNTRKKSLVKKPFAIISTEDWLAPGWEIRFHLHGSWALSVRERFDVQASESRSEISSDTWGARYMAWKRFGSRSARFGTREKFSTANRNALYEGVSKSFRTDRVERELQTVHLAATRCRCIAILWVGMVSFVAITLCDASQRVCKCVFHYRLSPETFGYPPACRSFTAICVEVNMSK
jgi:hypothetical protein